PSWPRRLSCRSVRHCGPSRQRPVFLGLSTSDPPALWCRSSMLAATVDPELSGGNVADDEVEMFDRKVAPAGRDGRQRAVGKLDDRPSFRDPPKQALQISDACLDREVEERDAGNDAVEQLGRIGAERTVQVEGIALYDIHTRVAAAKMLHEIGRICDSIEVLRPDAARQDRARDDAGARTDLKHREARTGIDHGSHPPRGDPAGGDDRADRLGPVYPPSEEAQFLIEPGHQSLAHFQTYSHPSPPG